MLFDFADSPLIKNWNEVGPLLGEGLTTTCLLMLSGSAISMVLGLLIALCRSGWLGGKFGKAVAIGWIDLLRNTPLLCQVLVFYYGFQLGGFASALLGLCTYTSAYMAEVLRAGFNTVPQEELRQARIMGLSDFQIIRHVLLPRSLESSAPALGNQLMNLTKNTAIAYFVAVTDLTSVFEFLTSQTYHFAEFFVIVLLCYGGLCVGINWIFLRLEQHLRRRFEPRPATVEGGLLPCL